MFTAVQYASLYFFFFFFLREMLPREVIVPFCLQYSGFCRSYNGLPLQDQSCTFVQSVYLQENSKTTDREYKSSSFCLRTCVAESTGNLVSDIEGLDGVS